MHDKYTGTIEEKEIKRIIDTREHPLFELEFIFNEYAFYTNPITEVLVMDLKSKKFLDEKDGLNKYYETINTVFVNSDIYEGTEINEYVKRTYKELVERIYKNDDEDILCVDRVLKHYVQTEEMCNAAISRSPHYLKYIKVQTPEMCMRAIEQDADTLKWVREQTPEMCMRAIEKDADALRWVKEQTPELCIAAVKENFFAFGWVDDKYTDICIQVLKDNKDAMKYVEYEMKERRERNTSLKTTPSSLDGLIKDACMHIKNTISKKTNKDWPVR